MTAVRKRDRARLARPSQGIQPPRVPWLFQCPICDGFGHVQAEGRAWRRCACNGRIWNQESRVDADRAGSAPVSTGRVPTTTPLPVVGTQTPTKEEAS